jgi:two-component system LytT family response regulator
MIRVQKKGEFFYILPQEINFLESQINYTLIYLIDGRSFISSYTLMVYDKLLKNEHFERINRGITVNWKQVKKIYVEERKLELKSGKKLGISRRKMKIVPDLGEDFF